MPNLYISKIQLPGGTYFVKDAEARTAIAALSSATHFIGVTTTALEDGATTSVVVIDGKDHTAVNGDIVIYGGKEFIYNASAWAEFGDLSALKDLLGDLAYHDIEDIVVTVTTTKDSVLGADTTFTAAASQVSFAPGTGSDFVTGYNDDAIAPSLGEASKSAFVTGYNSDGVAPSLGTPSKSAFAIGYNDDAELPSLGDATTGSFVTGYNNDRVAPSLGDASTGSFVTGYNNDAVLPSLGNATKASFAVNGVIASMDSEDSEMLVISTATTAQAVTEQGAFNAGSAATLATASAVTAQGAFNAGSPATLATGSAVTAQGEFDAGSYPTLNTAQALTAQGAFNPGSLPTLASAQAVTAQGTLNPGKAATLAVAKAITASDTATAAAQGITVGDNDLVNAVVGLNPGSASYSA